MNRVAFALFVALVVAPVPAIASECRDAVDHYNSALSDVSGALRRYRECLSNSQGRDDCSIQFLLLEIAQEDLEIAVSKIASYCHR